MEEIEVVPLPTPTTIPDNSAQEVLLELQKLNTSVDAMNHGLTSLTTYFIVLFLILSVYCGYSLAEKVVRR